MGACCSLVEQPPVPSMKSGSALYHSASETGPAPADESPQADTRWHHDKPHQCSRAHGVVGRFAGRCRRRDLITVIVDPHADAIARYGRPGDGHGGDVTTIGGVPFRRRVQGHGVLVHDRRTVRKHPGRHDEPFVRLRAGRLKPESCTAVPIAAVTYGRRQGTNDPIAEAASGNTVHPPGACACPLRKERPCPRIRPHWR